MVDELISLLWAPSVTGEVYAILDGARDERIVASFPDSELEWRCLYEEDAIAGELKQVAPYVIRLQPWSRYTQWLFSSGWGKSWGILCAAPIGLVELRRHLRRFLLVKDEGGRQLYFRYYDPRVLRLYLPTCNPAETETVFGPITRFWSESEDARSLVELVPTAGGVRRSDIALPRPAC
jgi:hypothetical protein